MSSATSKASLNNKMVEEGHLGNLTSEQQYKLRELWLAVLTALAAVDDKTKVGGTAPAPEKKSGRFGFGSKQVSAETLLKEAEQAMREACQGVDEKRCHLKFLEMMRADNPDQVMLRFLRARKWNLPAAAAMLGHTIHWRSVEVDLEDMLEKGEVHWIKDEPDEGFINQYKLGKSCLIGHDKEHRPVMLIEAKKHDPHAQSEDAMKRYTLFNMEMTRMCLNDNNETAGVIFDLGDFGLHNMDNAVIKFLIKCFEAHYPESLGYVLIYRAPWVFNAVWQVIRKWIDPVVAAKIKFVSSVKDIAEYIDMEQIPRELGGNNKYEYKYIEPTAEEDSPMKDTETRDRLIGERDALVKEFGKLTVDWIKANDAEVQAISLKRAALIKKIQANYWEVDPYIRSRTVYDRNGVLGDFRDELKSGGIAQPVVKY